MASPLLRCRVTRIRESRPLIRPSSFPLWNLSNAMMPYGREKSMGFCMVLPRPCILLEREKPSIVLHHDSFRKANLEYSTVFFFGMTQLSRAEELLIHPPKTYIWKP